MKRHLVPLVAGVLVVYACGDGTRAALTGPLASETADSTATLAITGTDPLPGSAVVTTDREDYLPGDTVVMTGSRWSPGETVTLVLEEDPLTHEAVALAAVADTSGTFVNRDFVVEEHDFGVRFTLTANGQTSGLTAQTTFTDGGSLSYAPSASQTQTFSAQAGGAVSFTQTVTAPNNNGSFSATLAVAGGGTPIPAAWVSSSPVSLAFATTRSAGDSKSWLVTVTVPLGTASGTYTANLKANPSTTGVGQGSGTPVTIHVTAANRAPTAAAGGPYGGDEGSPIVLGGAGGSDPDGDALTYGWTVSDPAHCTFSAPDVATPSLTCSDDGSYAATVTVSDGQLSASASATVTVANVAPHVSAGGDAALDEGSSFNGGATFTDPGADEWTAIVDYGDGSSPVVLNGVGKSFALSHAYGQDGAYMVSVCVKDDEAAEHCDAVDVTVRNVAPVVHPSNGGTIDEGDAFTGGGSFDDPGADTWTATVDYGDGSGLQSLGLSGKDFDLGHSYGDNGVFTIAVCVHDDDEDGCAEVTVTVNNVAPTVGAITGTPGGPVAVGTSVTVCAPYSDPGTADTHTASIGWNAGLWNGSANAMGPAAASNGMACGSYAYAAAGVYAVQLTVTDDDGGVGQSPVYEYVVVYDPSAGFVTGGGWIWSPAGAYPTGAGLTGKASFGFVSKYQKGAATPTGQTQFQFHAAGLNFHSSIYEWLVVSGARAQYKGTGTVNGVAGYGFMLTASDGQLSGGGGVDKFRIKIWEQATGDVVYDNQMEASDDATPVTALAGGSIVIQKR